MRAERSAGERPMRATRAYRLIVTRGGRAPALLADPARVDHIEVVEIDSGEVVLFWDRPPHAASQAGARAARGPGAARCRGVPRRAGVPWSPDGRDPPRADVAREWLATMTLIRRFEERAGRDVRARESRRLPAPVDRRGGDDRGQRAGAARERLPDLDLPLARPRAGARHAARERDGRAVRPRRRLLARTRRLDAHVRPRAALHGRLRDRRRQPADRRGHRAGERLRRGPRRSPCARSATAPPTRAPSARRSTSPRCGGCRSCSW